MTGKTGKCWIGCARFANNGLLQVDSVDDRVVVILTLILLTSGQSSIQDVAELVLFDIESQSSNSLYHRLLMTFFQSLFTPLLLSHGAPELTSQKIHVVERSSGKKQRWRSGAPVRSALLRPLLLIMYAMLLSRQNHVRVHRFLLINVQQRELAAHAELIDWVRFNVPPNTL